jgi:hypothetical protein
MQLIANTTFLHLGQVSQIQQPGTQYPLFKHKISDLEKEKAQVA